MSRISLAAVALMMWPPVALAQAPSEKGRGNDPVEQVRQLETRYGEALIKKDVATLERIWSDDYQFINGSGALLNKAQRIENVRSTETEIRAVQETDVRIRMVGGNTAVLTSHLVLTARYSGQEASGEYRNTAIWVKKEGRWQMVSNQITPIAK
jgi:ketosteroid isomerase-like protein